MLLKYNYHLYSTVEEHEIEVPDDIVFIHVDGDIGTILHDGYGHYLGASFNTEFEFKGDYSATRYNEFEGISLFAFNDVIFKDEIKIISSDEFYKKFDLGNYYIFEYTNPGYKFDSTWEFRKPRLVSISKILRIRSQYLVDVFTVTVSSWMDHSDEEVKGIIKNKNVYLYKLLDNNFNDVIIKKNADKEFTEAINEVLEEVNKLSVNI